MENRKFENLKNDEIVEENEGEKLRKRIKLLILKNPASIVAKITEFGRKLQVKYSIDKLHDFEAYRILVGSTTSRKPDNFDLTGEDSIEKFVETLEAIKFDE